MNILIIDDNQEVLVLTSILLKNEGYSVDTCQTGAKAMDYIQKNRYSAILLDRQIPKTDPKEMMRRVKNQSMSGTHPPRIIAFTADRSISESKLRSLGFDDVLFKPFQPEELVQCLKKGIGQAGN